MLQPVKLEILVLLQPEVSEYEPEKVCTSIFAALNEISEKQYWTNTFGKSFKRRVKNFPSFKAPEYSKSY
jgi:hypothetical protein